MDERIRRLEQDIMKLKAAYDQYFAGIERRPPDRLAEKVAREVRSLTSTVMTNTALRFRAQQAISRYNTYLQFWKRNLRDLEEGRKPRRRVSSAAVPGAGQAAEGVYEVSAGDKGRAEMDRLFDALTREYRRSDNGRVPDTDKVRSVLNQQAEAIRKKYGSDKVVFKIVSEDGNVTIKAGPADRRKS